MADLGLSGGTEADRAQILQLHHDYIDANARYDWEKIQSIFSGADDAVFFNLNGFTYNGRASWTALWKYYVTQVTSSYWTPFDIGGVVDAQTAVVWCHRKARRAWIGTDTPVKDFNYDDREFITRSTMVFRKEDGVWRVVHAHFSKADDGPRPGGIGGEAP